MTQTPEQKLHTAIPTKLSKHDRERLRGAQPLELPEPEILAWRTGGMCEPDRPIKGYTAQQVRDILAAVRAVEVCCQDFEKCREMCCSRADYWQGQCSQLRRDASPVADVLPVRDALAELVRRDDALHRFLSAQDSLNAAVSVHEVLHHWRDPLAIDPTEERMTPETLRRILGWDKS
jgi:hypothetical protein